MSETNSAVQGAQGETWNRADTLLVGGSLAVGLTFLAILLAFIR